ncbi:ribonuclease E inhibitor RraB, partial [Vibrio vulnificus]|nr:ribonuclease E inhibitor RraB [Vibrio vulnificus]
MSIVNKIIESAESDVDVLRRLDAEGDNFSLFREVDFHFKCPDSHTADVVAGFINDFQFGV